MIEAGRSDAGRLVDFGPLLWARLGGGRATSVKEVVLLELAVIVGLVLLNAVFAGAEIAVVALRRARLQQLAAENRRGARAVLALREQPERFFATVQVAISVIGTAAGAFGGATFAEHLEPRIAQLAWLAPHAEIISVAGVVILVSYLSIVIGELVPKSLALKHSETYALFIGRFLVGISNVARPFIWILTGSSNLLLRPFGDKTTFSETKTSLEELQSMVEEASKSGAVDHHVGEIASRALDFGDLTAKEVMIPRSRIDAIPLDASQETLQQILLERGHSRMPVYDKGSIDHIVGYIIVKDLLGLIWENQLVVLHDIVRPAYFAPETTLAKRILREFQERRTQLAVIVDEHGDVSGLVTLEDILEELVGELFSEHDKHEVLIKVEGDTALVRGAAHVREVNRALDMELPEDDRWTTVAGLCMHLAGRVPPKSASLEVARIARLEIVDASARMVRSVRIHRLTPSAEDLDEGR